MSIKGLLTIIIITLYTSFTIAQELNVRVTIVAAGLKNNDSKITKQLKSSISDFFNNRKWTEDEFEKDEKIKANLNINITDDPKSNSFVATFSLQSERPVFKSNYSTILINTVDKGVSFSYLPNQTIEAATNSYYDHLSAILTMYAYTVLAYDYDSFSQFGGDKYFNITQDILNSLPKGVSEQKNWDITGKNNKGVMVKNMTSSRFRSYRQAFYEYHRIGLDNMYDDSAKSKAVILSALNAIKDTNQASPNSTAIQMFADSKRDELLEIFKQSSKGQQKKVYDIMVQVDPSQARVYGIFR